MLGHRLAGSLPRVLPALIRLSSTLASPLPPLTPEERNLRRLQRKRPKVWHTNPVNPPPIQKYRGKLRHIDRGNPLKPIIWQTKPITRSKRPAIQRFGFSRIWNTRPIDSKARSAAMKLDFEDLRPYTRTNPPKQKKKTPQTQKTTPTESTTPTPATINTTTPRNRRPPFWLENKSPIWNTRGASKIWMTSKVTSTRGFASMRNLTRFVLRQATKLQGYKVTYDGGKIWDTRKVSFIWRTQLVNAPPSHKTPTTKTKTETMVSSRIWDTQPLDKPRRSRLERRVWMTVRVPKAREIAAEYTIREILRQHALDGSTPEGAFAYDRLLGEIRKDIADKKSMGVDGVTLGPNEVFADENLFQGMKGPAVGKAKRKIKNEIRTALVREEKERRREEKRRRHEELLKTHEENRRLKAEKAQRRKEDMAAWRKKKETTKEEAVEKAEEAVEEKVEEKIEESVVKPAVEPTEDNAEIETEAESRAKEEKKRVKQEEKRQKKEQKEKEEKEEKEEKRRKKEEKEEKRRKKEEKEEKEEKKEKKEKDSEEKKERREKEEKKEKKEKREKEEKEEKKKREKDD